MSALERLRVSDGTPEESLAVRGPFGAVEYFPDAPPSLHWHRAWPGPGTPCCCPLIGVPDGQCFEESASGALVAASIAAAGGDEEAAWEWLERLYERMAAEMTASGRGADRG